MFININDCTPKAGDKFFVDTNVWFWSTYVSSKTIADKTKPQDYQRIKYPAFLESLLNAKAELYFSPLILAELANIIEQAEFEIYKMYNPTDNKISKKRFRSQPAERASVISEIKTAWDTISAMSTCIETTIDLNFSQSSIELMRDTTLDAYDSFYIKSANISSIKNILTDDKDFRSVDGIDIYSTYS